MMKTLLAFIVSAAVVVTILLNVSAKEARRNSND